MAAVWSAAVVSLPWPSSSWLTFKRVLDLMLSSGEAKKFRVNSAAAAWLNFLGVTKLL